MISTPRMQLTDPDEDGGVSGSGVKKSAKKNKTTGTVGVVGVDTGDKKSKKRTKKITILDAEGNVVPVDATATATTSGTGTDTGTGTGTSGKGAKKRRRPIDKEQDPATTATTTATSAPSVVRRRGKSIKKQPTATTATTTPTATPTDIDAVVLETGNSSDDSDVVQFAKPVTVTGGGGGGGRKPRIKVETATGTSAIGSAIGSGSGTGDVVKKRRRRPNTPKTARGNDWNTNTNTNTNINASYITSNELVRAQPAVAILQDNYISTVEQMSNTIKTARVSVCPSDWCVALLRDILPSLLAVSSHVTNIHESRVYLSPLVGPMGHSPGKGSGTQTPTTGNSNPTSNSNAVLSVHKFNNYHLPSCMYMDTTLTLLVHNDT